jgi:hypothetical protein
MGQDVSRGGIVTARGTPGNEWQRIWFLARQQNWMSLAVVPSDPSIDAKSVATTLAQTGRTAEQAVDVVIGTEARLESVHQLLENIGAAVARGTLVIVPVDPVADNASAIALIQATSAALLLVRLGETTLTTARDVIDIVGRDRFIGSVAMDAAGRPAVL